MKTMTIFIPTPLRPYAEGKDAVEVNAATIADALDVLTETYPILRKHLFTEEEKLRAFVNLYLNDEDVRYLPAKERTEVSAADTLSIIPSIAGGAPIPRGIRCLKPTPKLLAHIEQPRSGDRSLTES
jgi:molybdopterin converting factor small subunit